ncbi:hypothetical protein EVAR_103186_1 [Eumeta japonica]|uniref:non-specific serine/threonine protein kinase n=1 Tax=Eumeta variegata TaxID=151549 RepID=A0A4C1YFG4_EUMVA|nr:hypothetical protein EVAR_103186_1 [Eumeta japonica]
MLIVDPERRLSLRAVARHRWLAAHEPRPPPPPDCACACHRDTNPEAWWGACACHPAPCGACCPSAPLHETIVNHMTTIPSLTRRHVQEAVQETRFDHVYAIYHLLLDKLRQRSSARNSLQHHHDDSMDSSTGQPLDLTSCKDQQDEEMDSEALSQSPLVSIPASSSMDCLTADAPEGLEKVPAVISILDAIGITLALVRSRSNALQVFRLFLFNVASVHIKFGEGNVAEPSSAVPEPAPAPAHPEHATRRHTVGVQPVPRPQSPLSGPLGGACAVQAAQAALGSAASADGVTAPLYAPAHNFAQVSLLPHTNLAAKLPAVQHQHPRYFSVKDQHLLKPPHAMQNQTSSFGRRASDGGAHVSRARDRSCCHSAPPTHVSSPFQIQLVAISGVASGHASDSDNPPRSEDTESTEELGGDNSYNSTLCRYMMNRGSSKRHTMATPEDAAHAATSACAKSMPSTSPSSTANIRVRRTGLLTVTERPPVISPELVMEVEARMKRNYLPPSMQGTQFQNSGYPNSPTTPTGSMSPQSITQNQGSITAGTPTYQTAQNQQRENQKPKSLSTLETIPQGSIMTQKGSIISGTPNMGQVNQAVSPYTPALSQFSPNHGSIVSQGLQGLLTSGTPISQNQSPHGTTTTQGTMGVNFQNSNFGTQNLSSITQSYNNQNMNQGYGSQNANQTLANQNPVSSSIYGPTDMVHSYSTQNTGQNFGTQNISENYNSQNVGQNYATTNSNQNFGPQNILPLGQGFGNQNVNQSFGSITSGTPVSTQGYQGSITSGTPVNPVVQYPGSITSGTPSGTYNTNSPYNSQVRTRKYSNQGPQRVKLQMLATVQEMAREHAERYSPVRRAECSPPRAAHDLASARLEYQQLQRGLERRAAAGGAGGAPAAPTSPAQTPDGLHRTPTASLPGSPSHWSPSPSAPPESAPLAVDLSALEPECGRAVVRALQLLLRDGDISMEEAASVTSTGQLTQDIAVKIGLNLHTLRSPHINLSQEMLRILKQYLCLYGQFSGPSSPATPGSPLHQITEGISYLHTGSITRGTPQSSASPLDLRSTVDMDTGQPYQLLPHPQLHVVAHRSLNNSPISNPGSPALDMIREEIGNGSNGDPKSLGPFTDQMSRNLQQQFAHSPGFNSNHPQISLTDCLGSEITLVASSSEDSMDSLENHSKYPLPQFVISEPSDLDDRPSITKGIGRKISQETDVVQPAEAPKDLDLSPAYRPDAEMQSPKDPSEPKYLRRGSDRSLGFSDDSLSNDSANASPNCEQNVHSMYSNIVSISSGFSENRGSFSEHRESFSFSDRGSFSERGDFGRSSFSERSDLGRSSFSERGETPRSSFSGQGILGDLREYCEDVYMPRDSSRYCLEKCDEESPPGPEELDNLQKSTADLRLTEPVPILSPQKVCCSQEYLEVTLSTMCSKLDSWRIVELLKEAINTRVPPQNIFIMGDREPADSKGEALTGFLNLEYSGGIQIELIVCESKTKEKKGLKMRRISGDQHEYGKLCQQLISSLTA